jgi:hypothetical protein
MRNKKGGGELTPMDLDSKKKAAYNFLEQLRKSSNAEMVMQFIPTNDKDIESLRKEVLSEKLGSATHLEQQLMEHGRKCQSFDQSGFFIFDELIRREGSNLLSVALDEYFSPALKNQIVFGSLLFREMNGMCIRSPNGMNIALLNIGALTYCELLANIIVSTMTFRTPNGKVVPKLSIPKAAEVLNICSEFFPYTPPDSYIDYSEFNITFDEDYRAHMMARLGDSIMNFMIAHEIGHALLNHWDSDVKETIFGSEKLLKFNPKYQQEHEADLLGIKLLGEYVNKLDDSIYQMCAVMGVDAFFGFCKLLEAKGIASNDTHPPSEVRMKEIEKVSIFSDTEKSLLNFQRKIFNSALDYGRRNNGGRKV